MKVNFLVGVFTFFLVVSPFMFVKAETDGAKIYGSQCASCHAKDGKGNAAMLKIFKVDAALLDLTDEATQKTSDTDMKALLLKGQGKMKPYEGKLTDEELEAVIHYVKSMGAPPAETKGKEDVGKEKGAGAVKLVDEAKTAALFTSKCSSCHGSDGKGKENMAKILKLEGAALDLTDEATLAKSNEELSKATLEGQGKMKPLKDKLTADDVKQLILYLRKLAPK